MYSFLHQLLVIRWSLLEGFTEKAREMGQMNPPKLMKFEGMKIIMFIY